MKTVAEIREKFQDEDLDELLWDFYKYDRNADIQLVGEYLEELKGEDISDLRDITQVLVDSPNLNMYQKYITFNNQFIKDLPEQATSDWLINLMYDYEIEQFGDHLKANHDKDFDELRKEFGI